MKSEIPSLWTVDADAGLQLAGQLARQLQAQFAQANANVPEPGGTSYLKPAPVAPEVISGILFYAIAVVNQGWPASAEDQGRAKEAAISNRI